MVELEDDQLLDVMPLERLRWWSLREFENQLSQESTDTHDGDVGQLTEPNACVDIEGSGVGLTMGEQLMGHAGRHPYSPEWRYHPAGVPDTERQNTGDRVDQLVCVMGVNGGRLAGSVGEP